jgi:hypothetical protein
MIEPVKVSHFLAACKWNCPTHTVSEYTQPMNISYSWVGA